MQAAMHSVTKVVQDKVSSASYQAMSVNCEWPVHSMDLNKDMTQAVVVGRQVFKIFCLEDDRFAELMNLRMSKHHNKVNLSYSSTDVAWNHIDENTLASAATNGSVVIWNLNKSVKSKQDTVYSNVHTRTVNRVVFHNSEASQLLSGSHDGTVKLHDLRKSNSPLTFRGQSSDSIRDVQYSSLSYFHFAAANESGIVQMWDVRRPDKCEKVFAAHNDALYGLDWHPSDKNLLATSGRDKMIKVWDTSTPQARLMHVISTMSSVGRIKWRPERKFHIASCQMLIDHCVNVYDIRRPFVPFACFLGHEDSAMCVRWRDQNCLLSVGKDSMLIQHIFKNAMRPGDSAVPCGVDININGDISLAFEDRPPVKGKDSGRLFGRKPVVSRSEVFVQAGSSMVLFQQTPDPTAAAPEAEKEEHEREAEEEGSAREECEGVWMKAPSEASMSSFLTMALHYRLHGQSMDDLCKHNSAVARSADRQQISQVWRMLSDMFCSKSDTKSTSLQVPRTGSGPVTHFDKVDAEQGKTVSSPDNDLEVVRSDNDREKNGEASTGTEDDSEGECSDEKNLANIASGQGHMGDFFFGERDADFMPFSLGVNMRGGEDWAQLPAEAFQPRHEITGPTAPPDRQDHNSLLVAAIETDPASLLPPVDDPEPPSEQYLNLNIDCAAIHKGSALDFTPLAVDMICSLAEEGDVQTCVSMLIVLGDHVRSHVDLVSQENWFLCYIDLLSHFELWTICNEVIWLCPLPQVRQLNQQSTTIRTVCPHCNHSMETCGWWCRRCRKVRNLCSICQQPVKGVAVWCQGCGHGGHIHHMQDWLSFNHLCPAGCGHRCEFT